MAKNSSSVLDFVKTCKTQSAGSTEPTFYPAIQTLLNTIVNEKKHLGKLHIQVNPRKVEGGMPDLRIEREADQLIGVVEVKHPEKVRNDDLPDLCSKEQVQRYREAFGTVLVTNLTRWILLTPDRGTTKKELKEAPQCTLLTALDDEPEEKDIAALLGLLEQFLDSQPQSENRPKPLALKLARRAQILHKEVLTQLHTEAESHDGEMLAMLRNASTALRSDFAYDGETPPEGVMEAFADTVAQAVTYGLFYARLADRDIEHFTLGEALARFPQSVPVLYDLITLATKPAYRGKPFADAVRSVVSLLALCDPNTVEANLLKEKKHDPVVYLYEDFLHAYNPNVQDVRGVYYTPHEIVQYMVKITGEILDKHFGIPTLSDERVALLDPAAGTGTFLLEFLKTALANVQKARRRAWVQKAVEGGEDGKDRRMFGFELLPAPYVILHQRINQLLTSLGAPIADNKRAGVYLTNTLENPEWEIETKVQEKTHGYIPHEELDKMLHDKLRDTLPSFRKEMEEATSVKQWSPVLVVMGNPPWQGHSRNTGAFAEWLVQPYFFNEGDETKGKLDDIKLSKWIKNDYVKFLRFAQWKIDEAPDPINHGIVALITDHSWLSSRVFAGMRSHLLRHFSHAYIVDLHGNSRKREFPPEGKANEPVFQIQQGVAITFLVKEQGHTYRPDGKLAEVRYVDVWGTENEKQHWMESHGLSGIKDVQTPIAPHYKIGNAAGTAEGIPLENVMTPIRGRTGVMSGRDHFSMAFTRKEMEQHLKDLVQMPDQEFRRKYAKGDNLLKDADGWSVDAARESYTANPNDTPTTSILYRPFDKRWHAYGKVTSSRPGAINRAFIDQENNVAIILCPDSGTAGGRYWTSCWATKTATDVNVFRRGGGYIFPKKLADGTPGIRNEVLEALSTAYKRPVTLDDAFYYLYGLFWTPEYRKQFQADLLDGYPPVIFPTDAAAFFKVPQRGKSLIDLHTLSDPNLDDSTSVVDFPVAVTSDVIIESPHYDKESRRYYLNTTVYAEPIEPEVMEFSVGGYQSVLHEYVAARDGRTWTEEDYKAWVKAIDAIRKTSAIQTELDRIYPRLSEKTLQLEDVLPTREVLKMQHPDPPQQKLL